MMNDRYVDDIYLVLPPVEPGARYIEGELVIMLRKIVGDTARDDDERLFQLLQDVANSIHDSIQVTIDYPSRYENRKIPTLDLKVWVGERNGLPWIMHEHYMKPMATIAVINSRSAISKRTVLTQEALRIILNCS